MRKKAIATQKKGLYKMPALAYLGKKGLNLTSDWQAYAIIGTFIIGIVVVIVGIIKIRKW